MKSLDKCCSTRGPYRMKNFRGINIKLEEICQIVHVSANIITTASHRQPQSTGNYFQIINPTEQPTNGAMNLHVLVRSLPSGISCAYRDKYTLLTLKTMLET